MLNVIYLKFLYFSKSLPGTLCASVPILGNCKNLRAQSEWLLDGDIQVKFLCSDPLLQIRHASVPDPYLWQVDPDPEDQKTFRSGGSGSGFVSGSGTLRHAVHFGKTVSNLSEKCSGMFIPDPWSISWYFSKFWSGSVTLGIGLLHNLSSHSGAFFTPGSGIRDG